MEDDARERESVAVHAAEAGSAVAREAFRTDLSVDTKADKTDVVTPADHRAQARVTEVIREAYPDEPIVGEEDDERTRVPEAGPAWIVDPIDGTNNYVRGIGEWATSVAAVVDGDPVAAANVMPSVGDTYVLGPDGARLNGDPVAVSERTDPETFVVVPTVFWERDRRGEYARAVREIVERFGDMRRFGCAQACLSRVAAGALEGAITNVETNPWDTVAGVGMVRAAGGVVTDLEGERWRHDSTGLVASNGRAHDRLLAAARGITD